ncbi:hypothetical protein COTS27_01281 [Spirochaetota bacterium]|nr:hypothetical protein COTS27_01281 [Spirochaetota bacterium]
MSLPTRILKILEAYLRDYREYLGEHLGKNSPRDRADFDSNTTTGKKSNAYNDYFSKNNPPNTEATIPTPIVEALAVFDLTYPTTLAEVTKKRNALLKTYHPDRFEHDTRKKDTANDMIQLINEAYEKARAYLNAKP